MSEEELIDRLYSKFCNENDDYDMKYTDIIYNSIEEKDKQLDKYKNVIDKIKELVENNTELYKHDMDLTDYRTTMNTSGFIKALLELLEEVE